jgi:hypothetical protein
LWSPPQSLRCVHRPQLPAAGPAATQYGAAAEHASGTLILASLAHATHLLVAVLHTGVVAVQNEALLPVHITHALVMTLQLGVAPAQLASLTHPTHLPAFAPIVAQTAERHTATALVSEQDPEPFARPHLPSGSTMPSPLPAAPENVARHTSAPALPAGTVAPLGSPHRLSPRSQTPDLQTTAALSTVHTPITAGVWPATFGICSPLASLVEHTDPLHHSVAAHCASTVHALPQLPLTASHTSPPWVGPPPSAVALQSLRVVHLLQLPTAPVETQ